MSGGDESVYLDWLIHGNRFAAFHVSDKLRSHDVLLVGDYLRSSIYHDRHVVFIVQFSDLLLAKKYAVLSAMKTA